LTTCPNCGRPVPENQRFCGNCGTDVQAAIAYRAASQNPPGAPALSPAPSSPYGYEPGPYNYAPVTPRRFSPAMITVIVLGAATLCLCCGLLIGGFFAYWFFPTQSVTGPATTPTPTPSTLDLFIALLKV
jgi:hypothetical protein